MELFTDIVFMFIYFGYLAMISIGTHYIIKEKL